MANLTFVRNDLFDGISWTMMRGGLGWLCGISGFGLVMRVCGVTVSSTNPNLLAMRAIVRSDRQPRGTITIAETKAHRLFHGYNFIIYDKL